jgi:hypothetical protein
MLKILNYRSLEILQAAIFGFKTHILQESSLKKFKRNISEETSTLPGSKVN